MSLYKNHFEEIYQNVPKEKKEHLIKFREKYPIKYLTINKYSWNYLVVNSHEHTIFFLPGATGTGEGFFRIMEPLASTYRSITLSYPPVNTIDELMNGILKIMDLEGVSKASFLGTSWGGIIAQCFAQSYPDKIESLILSNSFYPNSSYFKENKIKKILLHIIPNSYLQNTSIKVMKKRYIPLIPEQDRIFWSAYFQEMIENEYNKDLILAIQNCYKSVIKKYNFKIGDLKDINMLIIEADEDKAVNAIMREQLKNMYPHASVYTFHGTGHLIIASSIQEYLKVLTNFLANIYHMKNTDHVLR